MITYQTILRKLRPGVAEIEIAGKVVDAALLAAEPYRIVSDTLSAGSGIIQIAEHSYRIERESRISIIALGKAAPSMISAAMNKLGEKVEHGLCICKHYLENEKFPGSIKMITGDHPIPGENSLKAGNAIRDLLQGLTENDLVLMLISGGGSSLATLPANTIRLEDLQTLTSILLRSGASINEINTVRKHLDMVKGGGILRMAAPARVAALVLSDVIGDPLDVIASGPTVPDPTTFADAWSVIEKARQFGTIPISILDYLQQGMKRAIPETLKQGDYETGLVKNTLIGSNRVSCQAAANAAKSMGMKAEIITTSLDGEARMAGEALAKLARMHEGDQRPFVLILGGETTVTMRGEGIGGRNLEVALGAVRGMHGLRDMYLVTCATDGEDGTSPASGALVDGKSMLKAQALGLDPSLYLEQNNSYEFFNLLGDALVTGPSGTNVNDINFLFGL